MKRKSVYILMFLNALCNLHSHAQQQLLHTEMDAKPVFIAGTDGYACFRIPAIIQSENGELLAFAEGRRNGCSDTGNIDLVMKRSSDQGKTWGPLQLVWDDGINTCGNPAPILETRTGKILLLSTWNLGSDKESEIINLKSDDTRRIFVIQSKNSGRTWSKPKEITKQVKNSNWTWYATGPGSGIQLQNGDAKGRLLVGCDHIEAITKKYYSHTIYSDNRGRRWHLGGSSPNDQVNECEIVELTDNRLMMNMRNYDRDKKNRQTMISHDNGLTWTDQQHHETLIEPICQASLHRHESFLLFSNPASTEKRERMTVRLSVDRGKTWSEKLILYDGPAAYSDLISIDSRQIGCLYESGVKSPYEQIVFQLVNL